MANASAITIRNLVPNGALADPAPDVLDTGTAAVTLPCAAQGQLDRLVLRVTNKAAANLQVTVRRGDDPPAFRSSLGDFQPAVIAQNGVVWYGPFESARFGHDDGDLEVTFTPASGTINAEVTAFRLPKV